MGVPRVWSAADQVVVVELVGPAHPIERLRRLTLAETMARATFRSALAVGPLGVRRVGVLCDRDADLTQRLDLLRRMVADLPATVRVVPLSARRT